MRRFMSVVLFLTAASAKAGVLDGRIYPAPRAPLSVAGLFPGATLEEIRTADGLALKGITVAGRPGRPLLLLLHGNGSSAADMTRWFAPLVAEGYGLIAAEYRGYSGNPGRPSEEGLAADADAFLALARTRAAGRPIWVVGHSLGGGVALGLAARAPLGAVVTIGTFTRLRDAAPAIARGLMPDAYRNLDAVARLDEPWYLIHGTADDVISVTHGKALFDAGARARSRGMAYVIKGADHAPDASLLLAILEHARRPEAATLPAAVQTAPFKP